MERNCLYSTRMALLDYDFLGWIAIILLGFAVNTVFGVVIAMIFVFHCITNFLTRIYLYNDRIEYKTGFIFKISKRTLLFRSVSAVDYRSGLFGKIFNYGDVVIYGYSDKISVNITKVKNAKTLVANIQELLANA